MVITERAKAAVLAKLSTLPETVDAVAIYQASAAELEGDTVVSATPEYPGWQMRFVPSGHLPPDTIAKVNGLRLFPKPLLSNACLDYEYDHFTLDGEMVHTMEAAT